MSELHRRSPLEDGVRFGAPGFALLAAPAAGKIRVQALRKRGLRSPAADPARLPLVPNTASGSDPFALWKAPDDWLVYSPERDASELSDWVAGISSDAPLVLTDISSASTVLELKGDRVSEILLRDCTLDLEGEAVPPGRCAQTSFAQTIVMIHRPERDTWRLFVERSVTRHVWDWLVDSAGVFQTNGQT